MITGQQNTPQPALSRKRSLVRPEHQRIDRNHPSYHYRKHAQGMDVQPSTTGHDPIIEGLTDAATVNSSSVDIKILQSRNEFSPHDDEQAPFDDEARPLRRRSCTSTMNKFEKQRRNETDALGPPNLWNFYCNFITVWCPDAVLHCFGKVQKAQRRAWRERMGLCSIILIICTLVGYLTFGFSQSVCPDGGSTRLRINQVDRGFLIVHGKAYDLTQSTHPLSHGVPDGANVLFDLPEKNGGKDASFLFQNVNGACKGLITAAPGSDVPTNTNNDLAWYFPCRTFNQDGSTKPNLTVPYYKGYQCHTSANARKAFYSLKNMGEVYFTWGDVKNSSRNLIVWGGDVLDLNLLDWFNNSQVAWPDRFDQIRQNPSVRGSDVTIAFASSYDKQVARCFTQIIKVGSIDTESIGCIASKVVLYVSLVFILAIVATKFVLALVFQWFISRSFGATKTSQGSSSSKERK